MCGFSHRFKDCWYLGGKSKPEIQERFDKILATRSPIAGAMKAVLKADKSIVKAGDQVEPAASAASIASRQFDDHKPTLDALNSHVTQPTTSTDCASKQTIKPSLINR
jgi:hypothetical protein